MEPERQTKHLDPAALAGVTTGVLLTDFSALHEALEHLLGHPVWTHEIPTVSAAAATAALTQYPELPTALLQAGWEATRDSVRTRYGATVPVLAGTAARTKDPVSTLAEQLAKR